MPQQKFTSAFVERVKPDPSLPQVDYTDTWQPRPGVSFGLRVGKRTKTFVLFYRHKGKWQRYTLGRYSPKFTLADAHDEAVKKAWELIEGENPAEERRREKAAGTVADLIDLYIENWAKPNKRTWQRDKELLEKEVLPKWGENRVFDIESQDVIDLVDKLAERAPVKANRVLAVIRKMFAWAASPRAKNILRWQLRVNPAAGVTPPTKEESREKELSDSEIKRLWAEYSKLNSQSRDCLAVIAFTAQRSGEVMKMKKADIEGRWWTIPESDTKNARPHMVYLTDSAWKIIKPRLKGESPYIFPSPKDHLKPVSTLQKGHEKAREAAKATDVRIHDWRRTGATRMAKNGVSRQIISYVLNHKDSGITAIYDRHDYADEKKKALQVWEGVLTEIAC